MCVKDRFTTFNINGFLNFETKIRASRIQNRKWLIKITIIASGYMRKDCRGTFRMFLNSSAEVAFGFSNVGNARVNLNINILIKNGYPKNIIFKTVNIFLNSKLLNVSKIKRDIPKVSICIPFIGKNSFFALQTTVSCVWGIKSWCFYLF